MVEYKKNINNRLVAKYDKIKDWKMDPKGYFLISIDNKRNYIKVAYCIFKKLDKKTDHQMVAEIIGVTAIEIVNTLINNNFISTLQHAADMGIELNKAEIALKKNLNYIQDKDLEI